MIVVVFEVEVRPEIGQRYFDLATELRPELERIDGFISVERFESLTTSGKYVSLSFWRDAEAVETWRAYQGHQLAQAQGKSEIFADFRISVAEVIRQYELKDRI